MFKLIYSVYYLCLFFSYLFYFHKLYQLFSYFNLNKIYIDKYLSNIFLRKGSQGSDNTDWFVYLVI